MAFADLVFSVTLSGVVLFSSVVLVRQFLRGDLAEHSRVDASTTPLRATTPARRDDRAA